MIELDVAGIWTLVRDPQKAAAIKEAYEEAVSFVPLTAVFDDRRYIFFIRGKDFVRYNRDTRISDPPTMIVKVMPSLAEGGFDTIDATLRAGISAGGRASLERKLFMFRQDRYHPLRSRYQHGGRRLPDVDQGRLAGAAVRAMPTRPSRPTPIRPTSSGATSTPAST